MNVSSVGGSASLPVPLSLPPLLPAGAGPTGTSGAAGTPHPAATAPGTPPTGSGPSPAAAGGVVGSGAGSPPGELGDLRLPGQHPEKGSATSAAKQKEPPKPAPLPPLKGLTVAEIRAMLGVANPVTSGAEPPQQPTPTTPMTVQAAVNRYV